MASGLRVKVTWFGIRAFEHRAWGQAFRVHGWCSWALALQALQSLGKRLNLTLPETNMETPKGPYKDYSPSKMGLYGLPC